MQCFQVRRRFRSTAFEEDGAAQHAAAPKPVVFNGKVIENFEICELVWSIFLNGSSSFGESEGKQEKGIFPASLQLSTDLHSLGQFLQEGNQIFFETILNVESPPGYGCSRECGRVPCGTFHESVNRARFLE